MTKEVSLRASCVQYCSSGSEWSLVHLCWSLSVSFHKLIPPLISDLAHSYRLFFSPAGLAHRAWWVFFFFWLRKGKKWRNKRRKTWCHDWRKDKGGARTHCHNMTYSLRCFKDFFKGLWLLAVKLFFAPLCRRGQAALLFACFFEVRETGGVRDEESLLINVSDSPIGKQAPDPAGVKSHQPWVLNWRLSSIWKNPYFKVYSSDWDAPHSSAPHDAKKNPKEKNKRELSELLIPQFSKLNSKLKKMHLSLLTQGLILYGIYCTSKSSLVFN